MADTADDNDALSSLLQTSHYLDMFNDNVRNKAYRLALEEVISPGQAGLIIPHPACQQRS